MRVPLPTTRRRARIEIIPLIDIMFFLLATFVMVSLSMVQNKGIHVNLPVVATGSFQENLKDIITITVTERGEIYLQKKQYTFEEMSGHLKRVKAAQPDLKILINGDDKAYFGTAIGVLDEVRRLGITKVSIRTKTAASSKGI